MTALTLWLVSPARPRFFLCAAVVAVLTSCMRIVQPGRHWLYGLGVVSCLATLTFAILPTDPPGGGGLCGSVLHPHHSGDPVEQGFDAASYFRECDERRAQHAWFVGFGGVLSTALVVAALTPHGAHSRRGRTVG